MSLLVSWISVDTHGISSAYIASDSRASWDKNNVFDSCRKVFYMKQYPEIIGYCGDVTFPSMLITSIIDCINNGMIFSDSDNAIERYKKFKTVFFNEFHKYPKHFISGMIEILYINKDITENNYPEYYAHTITWQKNTQKFASTDIKLNNQKSSIIHIMGSGKTEFETVFQNFKQKKNKGTSRNIFQCFCMTLLTIKDYHCGGAPQLVGLYRKPKMNASPFGILYNRKRYYNGIKFKRIYNNDKLEWRNKFFERCDGQSKNRLPDAKNQSNDLQI